MLDIDALRLALAATAQDDDVTPATTYTEDEGPEADAPLSFTDIL